MLKLFKSLYFQVLLAITAGIIIGHLSPAFSTQLKPFGDGFIKLIKMMIAPIIFCTIVTGIAGMQDTKKIGRVGIKALVYFEVVTTIALIIGLVVINLLKPGSGMNVDVNMLNAKEAAAYTSQGKSQTPTDFLLNIIPENIVAAIANNNLLQVLFFSVLIGFALSKIKEKALPLLNVIQSLEDALFGIIKMIMKLAPIGAFGAMAFTIGKYGVGSLSSLGGLMLSFYITCVIFILIV